MGNCFSGDDALSRIGAYFERNKERFEAQRRATDKCNTICNELATLANKMFHTAQMEGVPAVVEGRLKAYADILSSMSGDLLTETE